jgi:hypothetical protein
LNGCAKNVAGSRLYRRDPVFIEENPGTREKAIGLRYADTHLTNLQQW